MDLITVSDSSVDASDLYNFLFDGCENVTPFYKWIGRRISYYSFEDGKDFRTILSKSSGGRKATVYILSLDMAKELSMVEKTKRGKQARKYFLKCEKIAKEVYRQRGIEIEARKTLTDKVKESGENERMHGHGYSTYTKLAYKLCGIKYVKQENFRDTLSSDEKARVKTAETMISTLLEMGREYGEIKDYLSPLFEKKKIAKEE